MARCRTIKSDIWNDEKVAKLSHIGKLLFIGIITFSDDYGKLRGNPALLKAKIFPYDSLDIKELEKELKKLADLRLVIPYKVNNEDYLIVLNWQKHQILTYKGKNDLPDPTDDIYKEYSIDKYSIVCQNSFSVLSLNKSIKPLNKDLNKEYKTLSELLKNEMLKNNPKSKIKDTYNEGKWCEIIRLMVEKDNRTIEEIKEMIIFSQKHYFWHKNILSMDKLRKQFDRLTLEIKSKKNTFGEREKGLKYDLKNKQ